MNKQPYTYTVLRYVHDVGTGEFANVGVVLTSPGARFVDAILRPTHGRLSKMFPGMNGDHFRQVVKHLQARFDELATRVSEEMDLGEIPANALELAHSVIAADDSSFQWSPMGSGLAADLSATLEAVYQRMVECYSDKLKAESRSDEMVWRSFKKGFEEKKVLSRLHPKTIAVAYDEVSFDHAWKNHQWHCLETVSFDLMQPQSIKDKAYSWLGRMTNIRDAQEKFRLYYLVGEPHHESSRHAFEQALNVLHKTPVPHEIVREHEAASFAESMADKIAAHDEEMKSGH